MLKMRRLTTILLSLFVAVTLSAQSPAPQGVANVVGTVTCEGVPVEGVVVSDGALFTRTDSLGCYALNSLKYYGSVFIITPSGYEPTTKRGVIPQFWAPLDQKRLQRVERHDFTLRKVDNSRHRMIFTADMHISSRNEDMYQFRRTCLPALRRAAEQVNDSIPVYSVILGDLCRNDSWYSQDIDPTDVVGMLAKMRYPAMFYTVMGENEYDGAVPAGIMTDHIASELYATTCAPRFYAFNIGKVHYVVLDNTVFRNDAGDGKYPTEIVGKRNYDRRVSADCLAWLRRDLETIEAALTAAETGHLVLATLHTNSAADTLDRIVGVFPEGAQAQIRMQLSNTLCYVLAQKLLPKKDGEGRALACEAMVVNTGIRSIIREGKTHQIDSFISLSMKDGSVPMDHALQNLVLSDKVSLEVAELYARNKDNLRRACGQK